MTRGILLPTRSAPRAVAALRLRVTLSTQKTKLARGTKARQQHLRWLDLVSKVLVLGPPTMDDHLILSWSSGYLEGTRLRRQVSPERGSIHPSALVCNPHLLRNDCPTRVLVL